MVYSPHAHLYSALVRAGERVASKELTDFGFGTVMVLGRLAETLYRMGDIDEATKLASQSMNLAALLQNEKLKAVAQSNIAKVLNLVECHEAAVAAACTALETARLSSRESVFNALQQVVPAIASIDDGHTLWSIFESVMEVESWWKM